MEEQFVNVVDAAKVLGVGRTAVYGLIGGGLLHPVHIGRRTLIATIELRQVSTRLATEAGAVEEGAE